MAIATASWAVALFLASLAALTLPSWINGRNFLRRFLQFGSYLILTAIVYILSFGPAVAIDQCLYNGNPLNGAPYGSVHLIRVAYPIQAAVRTWPHRAEDARGASRRLLESYDYQWRRIGSSTRVFLDGFVDELGTTGRNETDGKPANSHERRSDLRHSSDNSVKLFIDLLNPRLCRYNFLFDRFLLRALFLHRGF